MLTITASQMDALQQEREISAARDLRNFFSDQFNELSTQFPERVTIDTIRRSIARAEKYGFAADAQKSQFALLAFALGEDFDLEPRNHAVLTESLWHPDARLAHLIGWVEVQAQKANRSLGR